MTIDLTRRTLLQLAGASSLAMRRGRRGARRGQSARRRADLRQPHADAGRHGDAAGKSLDKVADYYRDVIGLTVMERSAAAAMLGTAGITLLALEARPMPRSSRAMPPAFITPPS